MSKLIHYRGLSTLKKPKSPSHRTTKLEGRNKKKEREKEDRKKKGERREIV
jgi:hypothetical protein